LWQLICAWRQRNLSFFVSSVSWEIGGDFWEQHQCFVRIEAKGKRREERFSSEGWVFKLCIIQRLGVILN